MAAKDYATALSASPDNALLAARAYRAALAAGDDPLARRAVAVLVRQNVAPADAALLGLADAARANDPRRADAAIAILSGGSLSVLVPALKGWVAFARGEDPLAVDRSHPNDAVSRRLNAETDVLLDIARGRDDGTQARAALSAMQAPVDVRMSAAELLFAKGRDEAARALLDAGGPPAASPTRATPAKATLAFGVSRLLTSVAGELGDRGPGTLVIALTQASLVADPRYDRPRLLLAGAFARDGAVARAIAVLDAVDPDGPYADRAALLKVAILSANGNDAQALSVAKDEAETSDAGPGEWQAYGDQLMAADRFAEAASWYRRIVDAPSGQGWAAWVQYGSALDQAGRWREAEPALERAVAIAPDQPLALNALGYAQVVHGEDLADATLLLQRAAALAPDDGSITDSLGWAYFSGGDPAKALPLLTRAAMADPANSEIAEHLGDVYWSLGRRYEARYAWRAAALTADPSDAIRLAEKVANGPPIPA